MKNMIRKEKCIIRRLVITSPGKSSNLILENLHLLHGKIQNKYNQQKELVIPLIKQTEPIFMVSLNKFR